MSRRALQNLYARLPFGRKRSWTFHDNGFVLPADTPIEEEEKPAYNPKHYYPVRPSQIFNQKCEALTKIGFGTCSTVWLVRGIRRYSNLCTAW